MSILKIKLFLVGERLSLADIIVSLQLRDLYTTVLDPGFRKIFGNTNRWFLTCVNQPNFLEVIGETTLATKMAVPKFSEKPKEEQKKAEPVKKEEKKPAAEKKPAEPKKPKKEEDEEEEFKDEKPRSLLDTLPKSSMDLEEWKRTYSNRLQSRNGMVLEKLR